MSNDAMDGMAKQLLKALRACSTATFPPPLGEQEEHLHTDSLSVSANQLFVQDLKEDPRALLVWQLGLWATALNIQGAGGCGWPYKCWPLKRHLKKLAVALKNISVPCTSYYSPTVT
ncbi:hypothetical protein VOLCADRAFT_94976 [Volvox carteri f. nagariensis]|uniref:Uncharacterized protein n=1 Tax=Volvox carteri f. nagariensis TaxID=3068 RepID=D8U699_VOLCA|nr:uncharacterized protein VOLCADRAFT_94976 [Volvox carteri f. nagariensis]EFJ44903.1 hypothetical protein VOLCADRAFT_94976 [Volvox carteri f. nagariensis]|eukprot:XP_002954186.1 hypothetical protein VOLCADRAFT_94976 [Volvox carteri f. nagariensis]